MLTVGDRFPEFNITGVYTNSLADAFRPVSNETDAGKWKVFFFYPKDFTFICPTEIAEFSNLVPQFEEQNAVVYGVSTDSDFVHLAWRNDHPALKDLKYPLLSDIKKELSEALGIIQQEEGVCLRATFIVDPEGIIRHASVNDLSVGRNPKEFVRILEAQQTGELCACNWQKGDAPLQVA